MWSIEPTFGIKYRRHGAGWLSNKALESCCGGAQFESRTRHQFAEGFMVFRSPSRQIAGMASQLRDDRFLPNIFLVVSRPTVRRYINIV
jgi:hypothetical protein